MYISRTSTQFVNLFNSRKPEPSKMEDRTKTALATHGLRTSLLALTFDIPLPAEFEYLDASVTSTSIRNLYGPVTINKHCAVFQNFEIMFYLNVDDYADGATSLGDGVAIGKNREEVIRIMDQLEISWDRACLAASSRGLSITAYFSCFATFKFSPLKRY